jgi:uncharacterized protein YkwD
MNTNMLFRRALALAAVIAAVAVAAPAVVPGSPAVAGAVVGDCTPGTDWGTLRPDLATQVVQLVNQHRASRGLAQLTVTPPLANAAVWKSRHMARYQYMQHADPAPPVARSVGDRLLACGYPATTAGWGENIAYGYWTANAVMQGWLNSAGHRANIENASFRAIGVAAAASSTGAIYWTQEFGTSTSGSSTPPPPPPPPSYACSNGQDDDGDGRFDYPADPGCTSTTDNDEYNAPAPPPPTPSYACSNGRDDDGDGRFDYPADPGCTSTTDNDEYNAPAPPPPAPSYACSNGKDDDGDGKVDYPADPGCTGPTDSTESSGIFG